MSRPSRPWVAITGSSSGIGRSAANYLAARGFGVVVASEQIEANPDQASKSVGKGAEEAS